MNFTVIQNQTFGTDGCNDQAKTFSWDQESSSSAALLLVEELQICANVSLFHLSQPVFDDLHNNIRVQGKMSLKVQFCLRSANLASAMATSTAKRWPMNRQVGEISSVVVAK